MKQKRKYLLYPPKKSENLTALLRFAVEEGAGRPADKDGLPSSGWTSETLADEISQYDLSGRGVELRSVQLWLQDNGKGISSKNLRRLAKVFGANNPILVSKWWAALNAENSKLARKRRGLAPKGVDDGTSEDALRAEDDGQELCQRSALEARQTSSRGLAQKTEALFSSSGALDLPIIVFCGAVALGLIAVSLGVHSVKYNGSQVGFLWAPNWTIVFLVLVPAYLSSVAGVVRYWAREGSQLFIDSEGTVGWPTRNSEASISYWTIFIICVFITSGYNWFANHLFPLLNNDAGDLPIDWSLVALLKEGPASPNAAIFFTGFVFLYMSFCSYLFFAGLLLILLICSDLASIASSNGDGRLIKQHVARASAIKIFRGVFSCTVLGLTITILIKAQSIYLLSGEGNIILWLLNDFKAIWPGGLKNAAVYDYSIPALFNSFISALVLSSVYLFSLYKIRPFVDGNFENSAQIEMKGSTEQICFVCMPWALINSSIVSLIFGYLVTGMFAGFSVVLILSCLLVSISFMKLPRVRDISGSPHKPMSPI